ncbi:MAG: hypothetical protein LBS65_01185 [Desulfovibrio sp.]|jgi:hypothetical protein|nr:hypothetical protein [Desulfovibrio sp.]
MIDPTEKNIREDESRAAKIARIAARLSEIEQEKVYYILKGIEFAESQKRSTAKHFSDIGHA